MARRIKALRIERGFTQQQLADRAGISGGYYARLERGAQDPTLTVIEKLAKALKVKVGRLLE
jgi:transcriptional regulator with XRE-family HTH domain